MSLIRGRIDGRNLELEAESSILSAARLVGVEIPTLCHHPGLPDEGGCRLCLVEISLGGRAGRLVAACMYPLREDGFEIQTDSEAVRSARRFVLELLINRCPSSPRLLALAGRYGVEADPRFAPGADEGAQGALEADPALPLESLCILCGRCARACEINGPAAVSLAGRGRGRKAAGPFRRPPGDCLGCLACASVCPTGAIRFEEKDGLRRIWGREFPLLKCRSCGRDFAVREQWELGAGAAGRPASGEGDCPDCRRRETASARLKSVF